MLALAAIGMAGGDLETEASATRVSNTEKLAAASGPEFKMVSVEDLQLDFDTMDGQKIEVVGDLSLLGDFATLTRPGEDFDTNGVSVAVDDLPRETRRYLMQNCDLEDCRVTIRGEVKTGIFGGEIIPESLTY